MIEPALYANLQRLEPLAWPIFTSSDVALAATTLASRFARAYTFLGELLAITLAVGLVILSPADWPTYALAAFPQYGLTHYDRTRQMVITGGQTSTFWQPALAVIQTLASA